jgi:flagellar hook-associated protein 3 FlgL
MRVTESRMIELAGAGVARARERAAQSGEQLSSGVRVAHPSDDPVAWGEGMRAEARAAASGGRGQAIARSRERLVDVDGALAGIGEVLARARELAIELGNDSYAAGDRAAAAVEVRGLRAQVLALANLQASDGEYLLAGSQGGSAPFDPTGAYLGDDARRSVEVGEGQQAVVGVPGSVLTVSSGVDILGALDSLASALAANDGVQIRAGVGSMATAVGQVASARADVGARMAALDLADNARRDLELRLAGEHDDAVAVDPVAAASSFARAQNALEAARVAAQAMIALARGGKG